MKTVKALISICAAVLFAGCNPQPSADIPLPEHPRPDFERAEWINLNGYWDFTFDAGQAEQALKQLNSSGFSERILVPFPWGSKLSEVEDKGDTGWYARTVTVPRSWKGKRVFLVVGASDWETEAWIGDKHLGSHQGGYVPFEFELTDNVTFGVPQQLVIKADDTASPTESHLYGKQGYGNARGIWQTVYLEARGDNYIRSVHFTPDIDNSSVHLDVKLDADAAAGQKLLVEFKTGDQENTEVGLDGKGTASFDIALKDQHLWDLDDPFLYETTVSLVSSGEVIDKVSTYFGQRKVGTAKLPGTDYSYIAINNKPVYLQLCLDQSYHPDGFYTFPSDEFMKNEILISKNLGLNGNRIHIKVEIPRKLYWADKLGLLIMADCPCFFGEPIPEARAEWEQSMREQVERDYNHPSIFSWVDFNETWGLFSKDGDGRIYTEDTQEWVRNMYKLTKELDPSRLVEDNSACNHDHVQTDINSWHSYKRGWVWEDEVAWYDENTFPGSGFNFIGGNVQDDAPMMNSECGNVWGYEGSAGDCDYTWDYHIMMNAFRKHPKCCGWLYTEHHDVINEWNGYVRYDRSPKFDGLSDLVPGMTIKDFHSPYYIMPDSYLAVSPKGGDIFDVPIRASFMTDKNPGELKLESELVGWNQLGEFRSYSKSEMPACFAPYLNDVIGSVTVNIPEFKGLYILRLVLKKSDGEVLHRNFTTYKVTEGLDMEAEKTLFVSFAPDSFSSSNWSILQKDVLGGLKVNGFGSGFFEYTVELPDDLGELASACLVFEASSKEPFGKDVATTEISGDYMQGKGTHDPCRSPNSYSMTDGKLWASKVNVKVNDVPAGTFDLNDDPADHRGILSWFAQPNERHLFEAGSYGQLIKAEIPLNAIKKGEPVKIQFVVPQDVNDGKGGLAIYGRDFGRYPLDPTLVLVQK